MPGTDPVLQAPQEGGQGQHGEVSAAYPPGCCHSRNAPAMPGRLWRSWKDWTAGCRCGMKAASSLPRRRRPVRYSSETATSVPHLFLSRPPAPKAWANAGRRLSNHWTRGQRKRKIKGETLTARPPPASPKPPPPQADVPPEGKVEGDSESQAQGVVASSDRAGVGNPQSHD